MRLTGLTIGRDAVILLEPDGYGGYRVEARKSAGPMTRSEKEAAVDYVRTALAERGLEGFGKKARWCDIVAASV